MIEVLAAMALTIAGLQAKPALPMIEETCSYSIYYDGQYRALDQEDIDLMARCVMSEAGGQSDE